MAILPPSIKNLAWARMTRAGCAMLWLLKDLGHSLLVTNGEEHGWTGSSWLMDHNKDIADEINHDNQFVIQVDRRNGRDFKCYDVGMNEHGNQEHLNITEWEQTLNLCCRWMAEKELPRFKKN